MEILAPAGSPEALRAAVRCGADAVYLGGPAFNARRNAANFDETSLARAVAYCRDRNVKVYLTLNTLVRDRELPAVCALIETACKLGIDALIVQDLGVAKLARACAPEMPLHASTQMSVQTAAGAALLAERGFSRLVLPRELSKKELLAIAASAPLELELFVHGALCVSVSGQCLLSAVLGRRSGNRGLCAQPCRLPFAQGTQHHALSLKDLSLIESLPELEKLGIRSLKIEGRMKRPEYVAAAVCACKKAQRGETDPLLTEQLRKVFSRSGFTRGYYEGQLGQNLFGLRQKEDVTAAREVLPALASLYQDESPRLRMEALPSARAALPFRPIEFKTTCFAPAEAAPVFHARFASAEQVPDTLSPLARCVLPLDTPAAVFSQMRKRGLETALEIPRGIFGAEREILSRLKVLKDNGVRLAAAGTLDGLALAKQADLSVSAGFGMNVCNSRSLSLLEELGATDALLSCELMLPQIADLGGTLPRGLFAYGRIPLMLLRNCPSPVPCAACKEKPFLTDRKGVRFPLICNGGQRELLNSRSLYLADRLGDVRNVSYLLLYFTTETKRECGEILRAYQEGRAPEGAFTRGLYYRGVE